MPPIFFREYNWKKDLALQNSHTHNKGFPLFDLHDRRNMDRGAVDSGGN